jgi:large subunit ribosomal protein L4
MELAVKNSRGNTVSTIEVDDAVFDVPVNNTVLHQAIVGYQLNLRQGTHDTKTRAQVSGGGRKPWIQKHTGRARQGSTRAPQWRHGGVVFGPHPRDYRKALPKRMRRQALACVLSEKARRGNLVCLDSMDQQDGKTRSMVTLLENLGITGSALLVTNGSDTNVTRGAHNIQGVWTLPVNQLNANDLLRRETLIMTVAAAQEAEAIWTAAITRGGRRIIAAAAEVPQADESGAEGEAEE